MPSSSRSSAGTGEVQVSLEGQGEHREPNPAHTALCFLPPAASLGEENPKEGCEEQTGHPCSTGINVAGAGPAARPAPRSSKEQDWVSPDAKGDPHV